MPKKFTHQYGREADWQGGLDEGMREVYLQWLEKGRHTLVNDIRREQADGSIEYSVGKQLLADLPGGDTLPNETAFEQMPVESKARTMQRMLTELSDRLPMVDPPPQSGGGQGQGGGGGGGKGQPQPQQNSQNGNSQPKQQGKQPQAGQGQQPKPQPKPAPKQDQQGQGQGQQPTSQPKPAQASQQPATNGTPTGGQMTAPPAGEEQGESNEDVTGTGGWSTGLEGDTSGIDYNDEVAAKSHGGGGEQYLEVDRKSAPMFYAMRDVWTKLAMDTDFVQRVDEGSERWKLSRVFKSHYNVNYLRRAKEDYGVTVEDIYFSLDTSGSVRPMANIIAGMAAGSTGIVHLFHGTEGRPEYKVLNKEPLRYPGQAFPEWDNRHTHSLKFRYGASRGTLREDFLAFQQRFIAKWKPIYGRVVEDFGFGGKCFELDVAWMLETERPPANSLLVFWGDTQGVGIYSTDLLRAIVRHYRFVWLYCYDWDWVRRHYDHTLNTYYSAQHGIDDLAVVRQRMADGDPFNQAECLKLLAAGFPVITGVRDAESLRKAMRQFEVLKKA